MGPATTAWQPGGHSQLHTAMLDQLPPELLSMVFEKLPLEDVFFVRLVCRALAPVAADAFVRRTRALLQAGDPEYYFGDLFFILKYSERARTEGGLRARAVGRLLKLAGPPTGTAWQPAVARAVDAALCDDRAAQDLKEIFDELRLGFGACSAVLDCVEYCTITENPLWGDPRTVLDALRLSGESDDSLLRSILDLKHSDWSDERWYLVSLLERWNEPERDGKLARAADGVKRMVADFSSRITIKKIFLTCWSRRCCSKCWIWRLRCASCGRHLATTCFGKTSSHPLHAMEYGMTMEMKTTPGGHAKDRQEQALRLRSFAKTLLWTNNILHFESRFEVVH